MTDNSDDEVQWNKAAEKLIELTRSGQVRWMPEQLQLRPGMKDFVGPQYAAEFMNRKIAVYEYEFTLTHQFQFGHIGGGKLSRVMIEFVDESTERIWVWPTSVEVRERLLEAIQYQVANPTEFLEALLSS